MSFKQEKVIVIISEFVNDKREFYPITNVPVEKARFFYKDDDGLFKVMASSDYAVRTELNETRLYITNVEIKEKSTKFQVGYEINFTSSEYETSLPVLSVLVEMYNNLIEDSRTIFNYVKKQCFISDDKTTSLVLPNLPSYCVWCMGENGEMFALPVSELYSKFQKLIDKLYKEIKKLLDIDYGKLSDNLKKELAKYLLTLEEAFRKHKDSLDDYTLEKIEEIKATCDRIIGLAFSKLTKADTIEDLKTMRFLKVGDIVEALGYYTTGDGANHKRIIANEDDGSGVQLNNGLWANIIHDGIIILDWFGNDYTKGFEYAYQNEKVIKIECRNSKEIKLTKNLSRKNKIDIDLNNSTFVFDINNINFYIEYNHLFTDTEYSKKEIIGSYINKNSIFEDLEDNTFITVKDNVLWSEATRSVVRQDVNVKIFKDILLRPFYTTYSLSDNYNITTRKVDEGISIWKNFKVKIDLPKNSNSVKVTIFRISRDNFYLSNVITQPSLNSQITSGDSSVFRGAIFKFFLATNINVSNLNGVNFIGLKGEGEYGGNSGYILLFEDIVNLNLNNIIATGGWGIVGANRIHKVTVSNCKINRFDSHSYSSDWTIFNTDFFYNGLYYPEFYGTLTVDNCRFYKCNLENRYDYKAPHYDAIKILNCDIIDGSFIDHYDNATSSGYRGVVKSPNIIVDNLTIQGDNNKVKFHQLNGQSSFVKLNNLNVTSDVIFQCDIEMNTHNVSITDCSLTLDEDSISVRDTGESTQIFNMGNLKSVVALNDGRNTVNNLFVKNSVLNLSAEGTKIKYYNIESCRGIFDCYGSNITKESNINNCLMYYYPKEGNGFINGNDVYFSFRRMVNSFRNINNCTFKALPIKGLESKNYLMENRSYNLATICFEHCYFESNEFVKYDNDNTIKNLQGKFFDKPLGQSFDAIQVNQLNTLYYAKKMQQEGVYNDYISYMDEKTAYDKQQEKLKEQRQLAYQEMLKENPNLSYEEFASVQPMTLNLVEEPQPSQALKKFMEKNL